MDEAKKTHPTRKKSGRDHFIVRLRHNEFFPAQKRSHICSGITIPDSTANVRPVFC